MQAAEPSQYASSKTMEACKQQKLNYGSMQAILLHQTRATGLVLR